MSLKHGLDDIDGEKDGSGHQPAKAAFPKDPFADEPSLASSVQTISIPEMILQSSLMKFLMNSATWFSLVGRDIFASYVTDTVSYDNVCDITLAVCFFLFLIEWALNNCSAKYRGTYFFWLDFLSLLSMIPDVLLAFGVNLGANVNVSKVGRSARAGARSQKLVSKASGVSADIKKQLTVLSKLLIKKFGSINKSFKEIDSDGDGTITIGQFQDVMQKIGISQESITIISKHADSDGSGTLDFKEFREALAAQSAFEMPEIIEVELGARLTTLSITKILTLASVILFMLDAIDAFLPGSQVTTLETAAANLATIYDVYYVPDDPAQMFVFQMFFAKFIVDWEAMQDPATVSMGFTSKIALLQKRLGYGTGFPGYGVNWNTNKEDCFSSALKYVAVTRDVNDDKSLLVLWCSTAYTDLRQDWLAYFESIGRVKSTMPNGKTGSWNVAVMGVTNAGYVAFLNVTYTMTLSTLLVLTSFFVQTANSSVLITPLRKIVKVFVDFNSNPSAPIRLTEAEIRNFNPNDILSSIEFGSKRLCRLVQSAMGEAGHDLIPKILAGTKINFSEVRGDKKASFLIICSMQEHAALIESFQGESILIFNRIADIFHSTLSKDCFGEAGQSTERGFVGYWKFDETLFPIGSTFTWNYANFALQAAVLSSIRLQSDEVLAAFSSDERWSGKRPISQTITFSLHLGSLVSGLMGSHFKFDVTSVSSCVNVLYWLSKAAHFYSSGVLLSSEFVEALPPETKGLVRKIEFIKSRPSADPAFLYTFDVPISEVESIDDIILEVGVPFFEQYAPGTSALFRKDYAQGFDCYISGDWQSAKRIFAKCKKQKPDDIHVQRILKFMESMDYSVPSTWNGYRLFGRSKFSIAEGI